MRYCSIGKTYIHVYEGIAYIVYMCILIHEHILYTSPVGHTLLLFVHSPHSCYHVIDTCTC